ncbi:MAG: hypothetical protein IH621_15555 [Krumholzibacteria bacterium]|nr:hypothetical protein [Candidatus Krumholzibacteria bacterium]
MKHFSALTGFMMLAAVLAGCGEDECPTCPEPPSSPLLYATGTVAVDDEVLKAFIEFYDINGTGDRVDSTFVDGEFGYLCFTEEPGTVAGDGRQLISHIGSDLCPSDVLFEYYPGETTELTFFCRGVEHSMRLHLLDETASRPANLQATPDEATGTVQISWNPVPGAEWYALRMRTSTDRAGPWMWDYFSVDSTSLDAPLPIPYGMIDYLDIYVAAGTGPETVEGRPVSNISGRYITGTIYSTSHEAYRNVPIAH